MLNLIAKWLNGALGQHPGEEITKENEIFPPNGIVNLPELPTNQANPYGNMFPVCEVLITPGQVVYAGQTIAVIETQNITLELPSPCSGVIKKVFINNGSEVSGGEALASIKYAP